MRPEDGPRLFMLFRVFRLWLDPMSEPPFALPENRKVTILLFAAFAFGLLRGRGFGGAHFEIIRCSEKGGVFLGVNVVK